MELIIFALILVALVAWFVVRSKGAFKAHHSASVPAFGAGNVPKREWVGEAGYCNCLLVTMARMRLAELVVSTECDLPNLEVLASTRPDTAAWLRGQQINLEMLDKAAVLRTLAEIGGISRRGKTTGVIAVQDVEGDNGPVVVREFRLQLERSGEGLTLRIFQTLKP